MVFSEKRPIFSVQTVAPQRKRCYNNLYITVDDTGGFLYMTLEECYTAMGANYQDVLKRFYKSDMIRRFVKMFLQDDSFRLLTDAMAKQDVKEAFRAAHTLKGVCLNLGFDNLSSPAVALTEILRAGTFEGAAEQYAIVKTEYDRTIKAIKALD